MANKKLSILTLPEGTGSTTYDIDALYLGGKDASQYMLKTSGEWNQEINFGSSGLLLIGRFPMYDSGVVVEINATTSTTYHGTLVLATQNIKNTQAGSYKAVVYGDADNTITPSLYIERLSGSNVFSIYFKPASWSKNVVHIQAVSLNTEPTYGTVAPATDICKNISTLPATATIRPTNALLSNFYTESEVNNLIAPAMIMRGTLGTTGTVTALPTASQSTLGDMYKVITAGTYATIAAKVNDTFVCYTTDNSTYNWMLIPSGDDVEDTWRQIKLNGTEILGTGTGTKPLNIIPGSNMTITNSNGSVTFDAADTTYSFASGTNCFTVTPSGGSAQTVGVTSDRLFRLDTRSANPNPYATDNYPGYTTVHLKYNNIIGITGEDTYSALMQIYPWGDVSGGAAHQLVYGSKGGIYHRYGTSTWSSWNQLATREWVESLGYIDDISDYVIGPGSATDNAIALYDGTTGKKIKNSGATIDANRNLKFNGPGNISWEDGSYYQRIQVTDDSNTETAVFTFQQTENSGTAWNDLFTIQDRGTIIAKNPTGGALSLTLDRGTNANWRWLSDNGNFIAQCDYTTAKGSYFNVLTMNYNTGHVSIDKGSLTSKQGFIHGGLTVASGKTKDDYVLLAGGGHKAVSDFAGSDVGDDYLPLAGGTMKANATITLPNSAKIVHRTNTTSNYVADAIWYKGNSAVSSGYDAQIGWHNTGDTDGAIIILPHTTTTDPWSSSVGLYISKTRLKYNNTNVSLEGHGHTDMVTGSGLTANNIVVGNDNSAVKISGVSIDTNNNVSIPGKLTVSTGAYISGRAAGGGDDEGLIIGRASNGYAGLILGGATGKRSVLYLMPDTYTTLPTKAVWRYNDGTNQSEIAHPGKTGTIALLSDLGSGGDYDLGKYVTLATEQTIDGAKTFSNVVKITNTTDYNKSSVEHKDDSTGALIVDGAAVIKKTLVAAGGIALDSTTTVNTEMPYFIGIDAFANGGKMHWVAKADAKVGYADNAGKVDGCDVETTLTFNSTTTVPTSKAVADYIAEKKTADAYWADQNLATSKSINTEPTFKSIKISDGGTTVKARWTYSSSSDCVELIWD